MKELTKRLKSAGQILGLNKRNAIYMRPYNRSRAKEIADDKLLCKKILSRNGIPTAEIYKVIRNKKQLEALNWDKLPKSFALKPNIGTGGSGILVFVGKKTNSLDWIRPDGSTMSSNQIKNHISNILDGQFSMGNRHDIALIEERIINHPLLKPYSYKGIPDIRIIVFNKVPIMAELRLPTRQSGGVANLHAGGIGVGIDIATGITTTAIIRQGASMFSDIYRIIETTPDEKQLPLSGIQIPDWKNILKIAIKCQLATGLGFFGADIALDRDKGPVVFELNARPGIAIQTANLSGMKDRLERVKGLKINDANHGIRVAQNLFGGEVEDEVKAVSGRQIIGLVEKATLFYQAPAQETDKIIPKSKRKRRKKPKDENIRAKVLINTGSVISRIAEKTAGKLGFKEELDHFASLEIPDKFESRSEALKYKEENSTKLEPFKRILEYRITTDEEAVRIRPTIEIPMELASVSLTPTMIVSIMKEVPYPVTMGRRDLKLFLVDASKTFLLH
ncbi:hypothetical protein JW710_04545 [Candidatus Dojkabacteria bacterium]|nr:hypothetical protein [Candidatus Dojkabacteria bacterium]